MGRGLVLLFAVVTLVITPTANSETSIVSIETVPPKGFQLTNAQDEVIVEQAGDVRSKESVRISVFSSPLPIGLSERKVAGRTILYKTASEDGGSGGTEFTTRAFEKNHQGMIRYEHRTQSESSTPNLQNLWVIIEATTVSTAKPRAGDEDIFHYYDFPKQDIESKMKVIEESRQRLKSMKRNDAYCLRDIASLCADQAEFPIDVCLFNARRSGKPFTSKCRSRLHFKKAHQDGNK